MNETEQILTAIHLCRRVDLLTQKKEMTKDQQDRYAQIVAKRSEGYPLQYLLGSCEFMGLEFKVDERALIPRPETEILVEAVVEKLKGRGHQQISILDLGTGSGNIAVSLARGIDHLRVTSVDISKDALELAYENAVLNSVQNKIEFVRSDMYNFLKGEKMKKFDVVISNPPYVERDKIISLPMEVQYEPKIALDGGKDGLDFYRLIIGHAFHFMMEGGLLAVEIGAGQDKAVEEIVKNYPQYQNLRFIKDYSNINRIMMVERYG